MSAGSMSNKRVGYRGYVTCRPFGGLQLPVPVQSLVLRDYCTRHGYMYKLHSNENMFPNSYLVLEGLISELHQFEGLLVTSMFMMPKRAERRNKLFSDILGTGASLHFVLEDFVVRNMRDADSINEILTIHNLLPTVAEHAKDDVVLSEA